MTKSKHSLVTLCFNNALQNTWFSSAFAIRCWEDLHAGTSPSSASGDYADVTVSSPYGVIPWPKVSRLNDDEMKRLMIDVVDRTIEPTTSYTRLFDENTGGRSCCASQNVILYRTGTNLHFATTAPRLK